MNKRYVFEMPGLYSSYSVPESVLQYIWFNGDFNHRGLRTESGKSVAVLNPGRWNHNEGPDFLEAILKIDEETFVGSVEIHFEPIDWFHHEHQKNPFFDSVILHVVLTHGNNASEVMHRPYFSNSTQAIEALSLLPYLNMDLESYAIEQALLSFEKKNIFDFKYLTENLSESERIALLYSEAKCDFFER